MPKPDLTEFYPDMMYGEDINKHRRLQIQRYQELGMWEEARELQKRYKRDAKGMVTMSSPDLFHLTYLLL